MKIQFIWNEIYKLSTKQNLISGQNHVWRTPNIFRYWAAFEFWSYLTHLMRFPFHSLLNIDEIIKISNVILLKTNVKRIFYVYFFILFYFFYLYLSVMLLRFAHMLCSLCVCACAGGVPIPFLNIVIIYWSFLIIRFFFMHMLKLVLFVWGLTLY